MGARRRSAVLVALLCGVAALAGVASGDAVSGVSPRVAALVPRRSLLQDAQKAEREAAVEVRHTCGGPCSCQSSVPPWRAAGEAARREAGTCRRPLQGLGSSTYSHLRRRRPRP